MQKLPIGPAAAFFAALVLAPAASAQFSDDFESYAAGSAIEGQAGWQNWDVCATGNQAFNTVSAAQAASGANSLRLIGSTAAGGTCPGCSDTTHELNGPYTAGVWTFTCNTYIPANFLGEGYIILLNEYNNCGGPYGWSSQVHFSSNAQQLVVDNLGGTFVPVNGDQDIVFDQWVEFKVEIDLTTDIARFYYDNVEMYTSTWSAAGMIQLAAIDLFPGTDDTTEYFIDDISVVGGIIAGPIGSPYCSANVNGSGVASAISAVGSVIAANNDVTLNVENVTPNAWAFFVNSSTQGFVANPGGSAGNLCLGGSIGRFQQDIFNVGASGMGSLILDLTQIPQPNGNVAIVAGDTWNFQCWHRDVMAGSATSNFSNGVSIVFQ